MLAGGSTIIALRILTKTAHSQDQTNIYLRFNRSSILPMEENLGIRPCCKNPQKAQNSRNLHGKQNKAHLVPEMEVPNKINIVLLELNGSLKVQDLQIHKLHSDLQILQPLNPKPPENNSFRAALLSRTDILYLVQ